MRWRYVFLVVVCLVLVVGLVMLFGKRAANKRATIAVVLAGGQGAVEQALEKGASEAADRLGLNLRIEIPVQAGDEGQSQSIEQAVAAGVSGLAVAPVPGPLVEQAVRAAVAAGIPVVTIGARIGGGLASSHIGSDDYPAGQAAGALMIELLGEDRGEVVVIRSVPDHKAGDERVRGFIHKVNGAGIDVVDDPHSENWSRQGSRATTLATLGRFIQENRLTLEGLYASGEHVTLGMRDALDDLEAQGVEVDVAFIGFGTFSGLHEDLQAGRIDALIAADPLKLGTLAVETLAHILANQEVPPTVDAGREIFTRE